MPALSQVSQKSSALGCFELVLSQFAIGINLVTAKFLLSSQVPFVFFMQFRFLIGAVLIGLLVKVQRQSFFLNQKNQAVTQKDALVLFWQAACGGFLFNVLMMAGLNYCSASVASITFSAFPAVLAIFSWLILKEFISKTQIYAFILAIFGVLLINFGKTNHAAGISPHNWGIIFILLSMLPEAVFVILGKWHDCQLPAFVMSFWANVINAVLFIPFTLFALRHNSFSNISLQEWWWVFAYSCSGGVMFFIFWYRGIARVTATSAALITTVSPLSTCFLAWLILHETINLFEWWGMICIIVSIIFGSGFLRTIKWLHRVYN